MTRDQLREKNALALSPAQHSVVPPALDDDQFDSLSDKQRVEYLAHAIDALEKLKLQIHRQVSGAAHGNQIEQSAPSGPPARKAHRKPR